VSTLFGGGAGKVLDKQRSIDRSDANGGGDLARVPARATRVSDELLQALPAAIYTTDASGRITFFNEAAASLWGCRPELGKSEFCGSWKLYRPDGTPLPHDECPMALALKERRPIRGMEAVAERPDGSRVPFLPYPTPLFDEAGALTGAINMLVDITERKRAEHSDRRRREEQEALFQLTDKLFRAASLEEIYEAALDAICKGLECERASILLFDAAGVMRFVAWRGLSEDYRRAVDGHSPWSADARDPDAFCIENVASADLPENLKAAVKAERIAAAAFIPLVVEGQLTGKFMAYYGAPHALSESAISLAVTIARQLGFGIHRMRSAERLRAGELASRRLAAIVESSDDAIVSKDLDGIVTSWNGGAHRVFGYTAEEMIGRSITALIPSDRHDEERSILEQIRRGERIDHYETVRQRKDGALIDVSITISPLRDRKGEVVGASKVARDITERKRSQSRLDMLARELQHRTKNLFAVVQAVVTRSFAGKKSVEEAEAAVVNRLRSLAQTHAMLMEKDWQGADLAAVVNAELSPYAGRVRIAGPTVTLSGQAAQNFALALHELATNAAKYGALSNPDGRVHVAWSVVKGDGTDFLRFRWEEHGGPPVAQPARRGFGSAVLEQVMGEYVENPPLIDFAPGGIRYELSGPLDALTPARR
jgi:PAS domain S-box-containing protein